VVKRKLKANRDVLSRAKAPDTGGSLIARASCLAQPCFISPGCSDCRTDGGMMGRMFMLGEVGGDHAADVLMS
jgi:hypothetical protein